MPRMTANSTYRKLSGALTMALAGAFGVAAGDVTVPLAPGDDALSIEFSLAGARTAALCIHFEGDKAKPLRLPVRVEAQRFSVGFDGWTKRELPDGVLSVNGIPYFARPRVRRYRAKMPSGELAKKLYGGKLQKDFIEKWDTLTPASETFVRFEVRQCSETLSFYLNGQFIGRREEPRRMARLVFSCDKGDVRESRSFRHYQSADFLPLDLKAVAKPDGGLKEATLPLPPGLHTVRGIPMRVADSRDNIDIGLVKQMMGTWYLECNEFLSRAALDGMAETAHFSVPRAYYTHAYALCAVDPDPERDPIITARLTRYARSGRAEAISDTTIVLPRNADPAPGVTRVGTVTVARDGQTVQIPLFLVEFKLDPGAIIDLLTMAEDPHAAMRCGASYLDFEFLGKLGNFGVYHNSSRYVDNASTSAVHVFGATLRKAPVALSLVQAQPGNIFHNDQTPELTVRLKAEARSSVALDWRIHDIDGETLAQETVPFSLAPGRTVDCPVSLAMGHRGWYGLEFALRNHAGQTLYTVDSSFAILGKDTRRAGYDSPYMGWWFTSHYGVSSPDIGGPLLHKAGIRKITTHGMGKRTERDFADWKITLSMVPWLRDIRKLETPEQVAKAEVAVNEFFAKYPNCPPYAMLLHETIGDHIPDELRGIGQSDGEKTAAKYRDRVEEVTNAAEFYREKFPHIKLIVGNAQTSSGAISALLRNGFDPQYIDFIGSEIVGQTFAPEKLNGGLGGVWLGEETARRFGVERPTTACYEFTSRMSKTLGPRGQAEFYVRDALLSYAFGFKTIYTGMLNDAGNAYYNTAWGGGGILRRNPLLNPKPAYVAIATLTRVLDQVTFTRKMPDSSASVHTLEFERADGRYVYAVWTPRGQAELDFRLPERGSVTVVDLYGREEQAAISRWRKRLTVRCGTAPIYLVSPVRAESVGIPSREYPKPPASFRVANRMDNIDEWCQFPSDMSFTSQSFRRLPISQRGNIEFTQVEDDEKGDCLQVQLNRAGNVPAVVSEYTTLRLKQPIPVPGRPDTIGLWVKGDCGWGKIIFEIRDASGALWRTEGSYHDWPGDLSISHDGWCFMSFPIDGSSKEINRSAGRRWTGNHRDRNATIEFPIKLVGLTVRMNRKALDLTEMKGVDAVLRFRDLGTAGEHGQTDVPRAAPAPASELGSTDAANVLWTEDFRSFDVGPVPCLSETAEIREQGGRKHLHAPSYTGLGTDFCGARLWHEYDLSFRFRFAEPARRHLGLYIKWGGKQRDDVEFFRHAVSFRENSLTLSCDTKDADAARRYKQTFPYADSDWQPFEADRWYTAHLKVRDKRLVVVVSDGEKTATLADTDVPAGNGSLRFYLVSKMDITDLRVVEHRRDREGE